MPPARAGAFAALASFLMWGVLGLYFKALVAVPPLEILSHRIIGGAVFALILQMLWGQSGEIRAALCNPLTLRGLAGSAVAIVINWGLFIWAVSNGHALEASLGYFIFPLVSVVLARLVLKEKLSHRQIAAVVLAALGVVWLVAGGHGVPWLALILAVSFGTYGLLRKTIVVSSLVGLFIEAALLAPLAIGYLVWQKGGVIVHGAPPHLIALIAVAGPLTAIPLAMFTFGARRLRLSTLGLMMYVNPTVQMLVAVFAFGEIFTPAHAIAFGTIWAGLVLYSWPSRRL